MSKRTLALIIVLLIVTVVLIVVAVLPKQTSNTSSTSRLNPTPTPSAQTILALTPNPASVAGQAATVNVILDSGINKVTAVQLELSFDPKKITKVTITPGPLLQDSVVLLNSVDQKTGRISYALGISPTGTAKSGKGVVATMQIQTILAPLEKTEITVLPKTLVTAEGVASSVLKSSSGTTIVAPAASNPPVNALPQ